MELRGAPAVKAESVNVVQSLLPPSEALVKKTESDKDLIQFLWMEQLSQHEEMRGNES